MPIGRISQRKRSVEHIQRRVEIARKRGIVYSSIDELLEDELAEEKGMTPALRKHRRQRRLALTGSGENYAQEVVNSIIEEKEFDVVAIVEEFQHALEIIERFSEAVKHHSHKEGKHEPRIKIVKDKLDDKERLAELLSRVSQVIHLSKTPQPGLDEGSIESSANPAMVVAEACKLANVDRIILATAQDPLQNRFHTVSGRIPMHPSTMLAEAAIKTSGVPYVLARFPTIWGAGIEGKQFANLVKEARIRGYLATARLEVMHKQDVARAFSKILSHPGMKNTELDFVGEETTLEKYFAAVTKSLWLEVSPEKNSNKAGEFLLSAVAKAFPQQAGDAALKQKRLENAKKIRALIGFAPSMQFTAVVAASRNAGGTNFKEGKPSSRA